MKMFRTFLAVALLLVGAPAFAQWQTSNHSVPIGKGSGYQGFGAAVPGTAGQPLVSTGPTTDPAFGNIANGGIAAGAADTYKGSLNGTAVVDIPRAPCTAVNQTLRYTAGVGESCGSISVTTGYDMPINLGLSASVSGNALTINLTQANGSAPTSSNPVLVPFRSVTLTNGLVTWATISAAQSITVPSGATLGTSSSSVPFRIWIFENYNSATPELGVATCSSSTTIFSCAAWESTLKTSITMGGSSSSAGVLYATTGVAADSVRIIGYCEYGSGLATAGTWASSCTTLQTFGPGVPKPGSEVQTVYATTTSTTTINSGTKSATALVGTITPTSAANLVKVQAYAQWNSIVGSTVGWATLWRGTGTTQIGNTSTLAQLGSTGTSAAPVTLFALDSPGVTSSTQYGVYVANNASGNQIFLGTNSSIPTNTGVMILEEIMGALDMPANDNINPGIFSQTG